MNCTCKFTKFSLSCCLCIEGRPPGPPLEENSTRNYSQSQYEYPDFLVEYSTAHAEVLRLQVQFACLKSQMKENCEAGFRPLECHPSHSAISSLFLTHAMRRKVFSSLEPHQKKEKPEIPLIKSTFFACERACFVLVCFYEIQSDTQAKS